VSICCLTLWYFLARAASLKLKKLSDIAQRAFIAEPQIRVYFVVERRTVADETEVCLLECGDGARVLTTRML